jgi:hypothetical protein
LELDSLELDSLELGSLELGSLELGSRARGSRESDFLKFSDPTLARLSRNREQAFLRQNRLKV